MSSRCAFSGLAVCGIRGTVVDVHLPLFAFESHTQRTRRMRVFRYTIPGIRYLKSPMPDIPSMPGGQYPTYPFFKGREVYRACPNGTQPTRI